jgi:hypothetical protein
MAETERENIIPNKPFLGITNDLLYAMLFQGDALGYEQLTVLASAVSSLTPPKNAKIAIVVVEADSTLVGNTACRFLEVKNMNPTILMGMPLPDLGIYEVKGKDNLKNFRIITAEFGKVSKVNVQYFG